MLKCYLGAFVGTLILIYALASRASRGRGHIPLPHTPPWAAKAPDYFNFSHVSPPKLLGQIKPWLALPYIARNVSTTSCACAQSPTASIRNKKCILRMSWSIIQKLAPTKIFHYTIFVCGSCHPYNQSGLVQKPILVTIYV